MRGVLMGRLILFLMHKIGVRGLNSFCLFALLCSFVITYFTSPRDVLNDPSEFFGHIFLTFFVFCMATFVIGMWVFRDNDVIEEHEHSMMNPSDIPCCDLKLNSWGDHICPNCGMVGFLRGLIDKSPIPLTCSKSIQQTSWLKNNEIISGCGWIQNKSLIHHRKDGEYYFNTDGLLLWDPHTIRKRLAEDIGYHLIIVAAFVVFIYLMSKCSQ